MNCVCPRERDGEIKKLSTRGHRNLLLDLITQQKTKNQFFYSDFYIHF